MMQIELKRLFVYGLVDDIEMLDDIWTALNIVWMKNNGSHMIWERSTRSMMGKTITKYAIWTSARTV